MYRMILKWPRRSVADVFFGSSRPKRLLQGKKNGLFLAESFQTIAGLKDPVTFGYRGDTTTNFLGLGVVNALQSGCRSQASDMLSEAGSAGHALNAEDVVYILEYCASSPDPLFVMEAWRVLEGNKIALSWKCYILIARALCNGGYLEEALHLVNFIGENNRISFILPLYNNLLSSCVKMKDVMLFHQCLDMMEHQNLGKNEVTYSALLKKDQNVSLAAFGVEGMIMNSSKGMQCSPFCPDDNVDTSTGIKMLEDHKRGPIKKILRWSFNDVIHACGQCPNDKLAEQLIVQMENLGLEPSPHTYDGLVKAVVSHRGIDDTMELLKVMQSKNLKPYDSTLSTLSICCSKALHLDLAEALLNQISASPYARPYNAFFEACDMMDQPERAVKMFAKMKERKIKPDITTYELLFSLFGNVNAPYEEGNLLSHADVIKRIDTIEMDMLRNEIHHSQRSINNLLKALGLEGMVQELLKYLRRAESQFSVSNFLETDIYNTVLHSLVQAKENHKTADMFRNMKLHRIRPDAATYNIMIDCCSNIRCFKSACALVSMMLRDGFSPQTLTYTALIKILLEYDAFDDALDLLDQAILEGCEPDVLLFNTILRKASVRGRIDVLETVIQGMHWEKIKPDPSTCSYVFSAYVDCEYFGTAVEALQVLSMRMISLDQDTVEDFRKEFEDLIYAEEQEAETRIVQIFRDSVNLGAALLNLRWCSLVGSSISWMPDQSLWAIRLASAPAAQSTVVK
ncbi:pentatricopeptide repeat-containing protein At1g76280 isoform X4 [Beta vulgaris subsp. vulgaris]|uniref:pentatricopeptide repeat-containing protein At1g76280 isoform X4 n=1 Tax=Beta vulgaris subsp. vulgaris TaxID=3555 RepID=UPI00053F923A|nr:pentatricopeptide repeat-containing protein At1g76280 isoform X4 [Beta vulgaris subsp. vulgaris]